MMKNKKRGLFLLLTGLVLIGSAGIWTLVNVLIDRRGGDASAAALAELREQMDSASERQRSMISVSEAVGLDAGYYPEEEIPDYELAPQIDMPTEKIGGVDYIGWITIPAIKLEVPVANDLNDYTLGISPARYYGSAYNNNLVIAAHNFSRHFGYLKLLNPGDEVLITDVDGNVFRYAVELTETLLPDAIREVTQSTFDLSLFTCTVGGKYRVCVRCSLTESEPKLITAEE